MVLFVEVEEKESTMWYINPLVLHSTVHYDFHLQVSSACPLQCTMTQRICVGKNLQGYFN